MAIYRYNDKIAKFLGLKTKVEPWLHVYAEPYPEGCYIAVYVWDTREVIEDKFIKFSNGEYNDFSRQWFNIKKTSAKDNHQKLKGSGNVVKYINGETMNADSKPTEKK